MAGVVATAKLRVGVNWGWLTPLFSQTILKTSLKKYKKFNFSYIIDLLKV